MRICAVIATACARPRARGPTGRLAKERSSPSSPKATLAVLSATSAAAGLSSRPPSLEMAFRRRSAASISASRVDARDPAETPETRNVSLSRAARRL